MKKYLSIIVLLLSIVILYISCSKEPVYANGYDPNIDTDFWTPSHLTAQVIKGLRINLSWQDNSNFEDGFIIERKDTISNFLEVANVAMNITNFIDSTIKQSTSYIYRIRAYTEYNNSDYSDTVRCKTKTLLPPSNFTTKVINDESIKLTWQNNCDLESGYKIERAILNKEFIEIADLSSNVSEYTDENLIFGESYRYRVKAYTETNFSDYSLEVRIQLIIPTPTSLLSDIINEKTIKLTWEDNCDFESGYKVERSTDYGSNYTEIAKLSADTTSFIDDSIDFSEIYYYRVRANTEANNSDYSNEITVRNIFPAPTDLIIQIINEETVLLSWQDNCDYESGYKIERAIADDNFMEIAVLSADITSYTDDDLIYKEIYKYRVRTNTEANNSAYSDIVTVQMSVPSPSNLVAHINGDKSIMLIWKDNCEFETGYKVERSTAGGPFIEIGGNLTANTSDFIDTGVDHTVDYDYRVHAFTNADISDYSNIYEFRTITDIDGNIYRIVKIGEQWWMAENLKVTTYRNGESIKKVTDNTEWISLDENETPAYCAYDNEESNAETYGYLYNWYAVDDNRNIAPEGWHVPTDEEWDILEDYIRNNEIYFIGSTLKSTPRWSSDCDGTDNYGFTGLLSGYRSSYKGEFDDMGYQGYFWSASESDDKCSGFRLLYNGKHLYWNPHTKINGLSIRCVKD